MNRIAEKGWEKEVARLAVLRLAREARAEDLSEIVIPDGLRSRVEGLLKSERERLARRKIHRRAAVILIAALLAALTTCMSIPAVREKLYEIAVTFHDKFFTYQSVPIETGKVTQTSEETVSGVISETTSDDTEFVFTFEKRVPTYIPAGYELIDDEILDVLVKIAWWDDENGRLLEYEQYPIGKLSFMIDSEDAEIRDVVIQGNPGIASVEKTEDGQEIVLGWNDGIYDYSLCTSLPFEETIKIAESVGKIDK